MVTATPLTTIISLARAGALEHAWEAFAAAGYHDRHDDPAALTVKGRLLKDQAIRASGMARKDLYREAAATYRLADRVQPGTYPLINAATLSLLAGEEDSGQDDARKVLELIGSNPGEPETDYWKAATEAEALLLLRRSAEARARIEDAIAAAPRAWEDHASTLRQFLLIHEALGEDPAWLDVLRPPRSLSFGNHLPLAGTTEGEVSKAAAEAIELYRVRFGYCTLAAGGDIEFAEALIEADAQLNVVLPSDTRSFARRYVDPHGPDWRKRFEAALEKAETVHHVRPLGGEPDAAAMSLAHRIAAGSARLNAERLMSSAEEFRIPDGEQHDGSAAHPGKSPIPLLSISVGSAADEGYESRLRAVRESLDDAVIGAVAPHLSGDEVLLGLSSVAGAAATALRVHARRSGGTPIRIGAHYGRIPVVADPFLGASRPTDEGLEIVRAIVQASPPDSICVSLDFAAMLAMEADAPSCASEIGELRALDGGNPIPLYALRPLASGD